MSVDAAVVSEIVRRVLREQGGAAAPQAVPVGVSNRHIHLTQEHVEILFGKGYALTPLKDLSQPVCLQGAADHHRALPAAH